MASDTVMPSRILFSLVQHVSDLVLKNVLPVIFSTLASRSVLNPLEIHSNCLADADLPLQLAGDVLSVQVQRLEGGDQGTGTTKLFI